MKNNFNMKNSILAFKLLSATLLLFLGFNSQLVAQNNMGIGLTTPHAGAILHIDASARGLLIPRATSSVVDWSVIADGSDNGEGMLRYDMTVRKLQTWSGSSWKALGLWDQSTNGSIFYNPTHDAGDEIKGNVGINIVADVNNNLYVYRGATVISDYGPGKSNIYAYRLGTNVANQGGSSMQASNIDSAIKGISAWGNNYTAGVAGYSEFDFDYSAGVIGGHTNASTWGALGYKDGNSDIWAGYFNGKGYFSDEVGIGLPITGSNTVPTIDLAIGDNDTGLNQEGDGQLAIYTNSVERLRINSSGNVGIDATSPNSPLSISPSTSEAKITLYDGGSTINHYGFGVSGSQLNYHANLEASHVFYTGGKNGNGTELMRIKSNGRVGIGTDNPTKGQLHVDDFVNYNIARCWQAGDGSPNDTPTESISDCNLIDPSSGDLATSIFAEYSIGTDWRFYVTSDARIKNIKGRSNSQQDLDALKNIEITDYTMKDVIVYGNEKTKKVIAQQVKSVYPQAISYSTSEIPDIYQPTTVAKGWVNLSTDLQVGEKVQLIFGAEKELFEVLETKADGFRVETDRTGDVFVYGRQVDDFHSVDYDAISMLNVSATQEIAKQLEALQVKNKAQEDKIIALEQQLTDLDQIKAQLAKIEAMLQTTTPATVNDSASER
jgi:hypothetical protein